MGRDHLKNIRVGGRVTTKFVFKEVAYKGVDWIELGKDRVQWRALLNMIVNFRVL
jgi:hypothetical protein